MDITDGIVTRIRTFTSSVGVQITSCLFKIFDIAGIRDSGEDTVTAQTLPWQSRVYRRLSATFGGKLPYVLLSLVLSILYLIAVLGEANETAIYIPQNTNKNLRGVANTNNTVVGTTPASNTHTTSTSKVNSGKHESSSSFMFSMFVSVLFWLFMVQLWRYLRHVALARAVSNRASNPNASRESIQLLSQLLQMGRGGGPAALTGRLRMALLQRDFTGDDYEMLQALDDSPRAQRGATEEQIDRLPLHSISHNEAAEAPPCNICLAPYEEGEEVRTVPCMHKFHRACIDTWLRDKAICPICKCQCVA